MFFSKPYNRGAGWILTVHPAKLFSKADWLTNKLRPCYYHPHHLFRRAKENQSSATRRASEGRAVVQSLLFPVCDCAGNACDAPQLSATAKKTAHYSETIQVQSEPLGLDEKIKFLLRSDCWRKCGHYWQDIAFGVWLGREKVYQQVALQQA